MRKSTVLFVALALSLSLCERQPAAAAGGNSTAYCLSGRMANGVTTAAGQTDARAQGYLGTVAVPRPGRVASLPLGVVVETSAGPYGAGRYLVTDRIGRGSQLDYSMPGDCRGARVWGRRNVSVVQVEGMP